MRRGDNLAREQKLGCSETEDPRDSLLRRILGALNRSRIMPFPRNVVAEREYSKLCREYRERFGHLTIPTSLPLRLIRTT